MDGSGSSVTSAPKDAAPGDSNRRPKIIGGIIGGVVGAVLVVLALYCVVISRRRSRLRRELRMQQFQHPDDLEKQRPPPAHRDVPPRNRGKRNLHMSYTTRPLPSDPGMVSNGSEPQSLSSPYYQSASTNAIANSNPSAASAGTSTVSLTSRAPDSHPASGSGIASPHSRPPPRDPPAYTQDNVPENPFL